MPRSLTSVLTPHGALRLEPGEAEAPIEEAVAERLEGRFARGPGHGLLQLGLSEAGTFLPPALAFWRSFATRFVAALCSRTEAIAVPPPSLKELATLIDAAPYILRRLKTDKSVVADLPDKTEVKAFCSLSKRQAALYQATVADLEQRLKQSEDDIARRGLVLAMLMHLKQICNHPAQWLGDGSYDAEEGMPHDLLKIAH